MDPRDAFEAGEANLRDSFLPLAESCLRFAYAGYAKENGADDPDTLRALERLAVAIRYQGPARYADAEVYARRAFEKTDRVSGMNNNDTQTALRDLALLLRLEKKYAEAEKFDRAIYQYYLNAPIYGEKNLVTLAALDQIADDLRFENRATEAEPLLRQSYAIRSAAAPSSRTTLASLSRLARILEDELRYGDAEKLHRDLVAQNAKAFGPEDSETLEAESDLAFDLREEQQYAEAESLSRKLVEIYSRIEGPDSEDAVFATEDVALAVYYQGRVSDSEPFFKRVYDVRIKQPPGDVVFQAMRNLAVVERNLGNAAGSEAIYRQVYDLHRREAGDTAPETVDALRDLAQLIWGEGRQREAHAMVQGAFDALRAKEPKSGELLVLLDDLAHIAEQEHKPADAVALWSRRHELSVVIHGADAPETQSAARDVGVFEFGQKDYTDAEKWMRTAYEAGGKNGLDTATTRLAEHDLVVILVSQQKWSEADPIVRDLVARQQRLNGRGSPEAVEASYLLGLVLGSEKRFQDAESVLRENITLSLSADGKETVATIENQRLLARVLFADGKRADAEQPLRDAVAAADAVKDTETAADARMLLGSVFFNEGKAGEAAEVYRQACPSDKFPEPDTKHEDCNGYLALALWQMAHGPAGANETAMAALRDEAFGAAQRSTVSLLAQAIRGGSVNHLKDEMQSDGSLAGYQAAAQNQADLQKQINALAQDSSSSTQAKQKQLEQTLAQVNADFDKTTARLKSRYPEYVKALSLSALSPQSLQEDSDLLARDEALVLWLVAPGDDHGLVFALSRRKFAWAQIALSGNEIERRVEKLHAALDRGTGGTAVPFDFKASNELYAALLGDPGIQDVIKDAKTLIAVPSGWVTNLPLMALVAAPPSTAASPPGATDFRAAHWLVQDKAVAISPSVASLQALRVLPRHTSRDSIVIGDPSTQSGASGTGGSYRSLKGSGDQVDQLLKTYGPLKFSKVEAAAAASTLNTSPNRILTGDNATTDAIDGLQKDGTLQKAGVIVLSTYTLDAGGDGSAIVMSPPGAGATPATQLLSGTQISNLRLDADLLVLSGSYTIVPSTPSTEDGFSSIAGAFLFAGAHSVLGTEWDVDDEAAERIAVGTIRHRAKERLKNPEALRKSVLDLMADTTRDSTDASFANPAQWAPFVLVGP